MHQQPGAGDADLAGVGEDRQDGAVESRFDVGIGEDDVRRLAPQLHHRPQVVASGHLHDAARVADRSGDLREQRRHLRGTLEVVLLALDPEAVGVVQVGRGAHAQEHVMGFVLLPPDVVQVVRAHERQADLRPQSEQLARQRVLLGHAVVLDLQVEAVLAEDVRVLARETPRAVPVVRLQCPRDLATEAGREADEPLAVPRQVLLVDTRLVVIAVDVGIRDQAAQVLVAGPILGLKQEGVRLVIQLAVPVANAASRDIRLHADDRLDALRLARLIERDRSVQRPVVRDGERIEAQGRGLADQVVDAAEAVEQAELGVRVEVCEVVRGDAHPRPKATTDRLGTAAS